MATKIVDESNALSNGPHFLITHERVVERDEDTHELVSVVRNDTYFELRRAPIPDKNFAVYVQREATTLHRNYADRYAAVVLGITGLRSDVSIAAAIRLYRLPAPYEPPGLALRAPGDGPLCMRGTGAELPDLLADAFRQLIPPRSKVLTPELIFQVDGAVSRVRMRVRHAIAASIKSPNDQAQWNGV